MGCGPGHSQIELLGFFAVSSWANKDPAERVEGPCVFRIRPARRIRQRPTTNDQGLASNTKKAAPQGGL